MMVGKLIYVTGISGTGVEASLRKYLDSPTVNASGRPFRLVKFEDDYLVNEAREYQHLLPIPIDEANILDIVSLPKPVLKLLWTKAFQKALTEANRLRVEHDADVLFTFHACWYHLENREHLSCVDFSLLGEQAAKADLVITLVDDIYDVKSRLGMPGGLFQPRIVPDSDALDSIVKLTRILEWRGIETLLSERIAQLCANRKHFVFAVKHPIDTFHLLLKDNPKIVYLAHPISEIRRMFEVDPDFRTGG